MRMRQEKEEPGRTKWLQLPYRLLLPQGSTDKHGLARQILAVARMQTTDGIRSKLRGQRNHGPSKGRTRYAKWFQPPGSARTVESYSSVRCWSEVDGSSESPQRRSMTRKRITSAREGGRIDRSCARAARTSTSSQDRDSAWRGCPPPMRPRGRSRKVSEIAS